MPSLSRSSSAYKLQPTSVVAEKPAVKKSKRTAKKKKKTIKHKLVMLVLGAFSIQLFLCYRWVALYGLHSEIARNNAQLESLLRENEQRAVTIDKMVDASKVEEYAINKLGMQRIESNQIVYIKPMHGDSMQKVAKNKSRSSKRGIFGAISSSVGGVLEYLR